MKFKQFLGTHPDGTLNGIVYNFQSYPEFDNPVREPMKNSIIFRDDDISCFTKLEDFKRVHDLFIKYDTKHVIAVIAKDIETHSDLVEYIKANPLIDVQLHCWEHYDHTEAPIATLMEDIPAAIAKIKEVFGVTPTLFFPPWNRSNVALESACAASGLTVSCEKISLSQYVRKMGGVSESTINFHYWADQETMLLEQALRIHRDIKSKCI